MKIYVDGDACPVINETVRLARRAGTVVVIAHSRHHEISCNEEHVQICETGDRPDAVDHFIFNEVSPNDVVVTDDLGLATLALSQDAKVVRFRGDRPSREDIEIRLSMREANRRERSRKQRVGGPSEFTDRDRDRYVESLERLLDLPS